MKKYLISLEKDANRRELFFAQPDSAGFEVFSAINTMQCEWQTLAEKFDLDKFEQHYSRKVTKGEIGCTLSHLAVYQKICDDNQTQDNEYCLVCEDDALFNANFNQNVQQITQIEQHCGLILVGQSKIADFNHSELEINYPITFSCLAKNINPPFKIAYPYKDYFAGTVAYLIQKRAAKIFLQQVEQYQRPFWLADDFILFHQRFNLENKVIRPLLAIENPQLASNLATQRGAISHNLLQKLLKYPLKKLFALKRNLGK